MLESKKEKLELVLSKVPDDQKDAFIAELREAKTKKEKVEVAKKYNATLTEKEVKHFVSKDNKLSDEELDEAAGGCCNCGCDCDCIN